MHQRELTPEIAPGLIWSLVDEDSVVVSPELGQVRVLNGVGTVIWRLLVEEARVEEIEVYLVDHYEVAETQARRDVKEFLDELVARELVLWKT
jgi:hypothetical protein